MEKPDLPQSTAPSTDSPPSYLPYEIPQDEPVTKLHFDLALQAHDRGLRREFAIVHEKIFKTQGDVETLKEDVGVLKEDVGTLKKDVGILQGKVSDLEALSRNSRARAPGARVYPISQDGEHPVSFPTSVIRLWRLPPLVLTSLLMFYNLNFYYNFDLSTDDEGLVASQDSVRSSVDNRRSLEPEENLGFPVRETADTHGFDTGRFWSEIESESPIPADTLSTLVQRYKKSALHVLALHLGIDYDDIDARFHKIEQRAQMRYYARGKRKADDSGLAPSGKKAMTTPPPITYARIRDTESFRALIKDPENPTEPSVQSPLDQVTWDDRVSPPPPRRLTNPLGAVSEGLHLAGEAAESARDTSTSSLASRFKHHPNVGEESSGTHRLDSSPEL